MFVFVEGTKLPVTVDDNAIYFVRDAHELYLGRNKIGDALNLDFIGTGAGFHNSIYRGKSLGEVVTDKQYAAIADGTFEDLYIGDYWDIGGIIWRIAAFDYYYQTGDVACTQHHVTIVPDRNLYDQRMNSSNVTTTGYAGSEMRLTGLEKAKEIIKASFGDSHILNHRQYLTNASTNGHPSAGAWYDSEVELMTEQNVYGCKIFGPVADGYEVFTNYTIDKSQFPLFAFRHDLIGAKSEWHWLRDVVSASYFAVITKYCNSDAIHAKYRYGVRPAFSIIG